MGRIRLNTEKITKLGLIALAISLFVLMLRGCAIARGRADSDSDAPAADGDDATVSIYDADTDKVYSLPLEEYVLRVTAAEMPASFAEEALKAQSVPRAHIPQERWPLSAANHAARAARTYARTAPAAKHTARGMSFPKSGAIQRTCTSIN